jgi:voltage-gated potassium channel
MAFIAITATMILNAILKDHMASKRSILGAISVYLLLGLSWTCAYSALEIFALGNIAEEPFRFTERQTIETPQGQPLTAWPQLVYYSFVTMSTLGFGDITPRTPLAQTMTWMQAVFGQLYLVILIARLVSLLPQNNVD